MIEQSLVCVVYEQNYNVLIYVGLEIPLLCQQLQNCEYGAKG